MLISITQSERKHRMKACEKVALHFLIAYGNDNYLFMYECFTALRRFEVDFILLAGYLKLIPVELIRAYPKSIFNIHPSLLPAFGGKGYYGMKVHKAVIASGARYILH